MTYELLDKASSGNTGKDHTMRIDVLKAGVPSRSALDSAYQGVKSALDQVMVRQDTFDDGMDIPGYFIRKYTTEKTLNCSNLLNDGGQWLNNHGFSDGHHLWVTNCDRAFSEKGGAWEGRTQGFVSTRRYGSGDYLGAVAIQECFHAFLKSNASSVPSDHHVLGRDKPRPSGDFVTPMAASYEDGSENYESKGNCSLDTGTDGVTQSLTNCTIKGLRRSRAEAWTIW